MTRQQAASRAGQALVTKKGKRYMREIGSRGGRAFWRKYTLQPFGGNDFIIKNRVTGEWVNTLSGRGAEIIRGQHGN